MPHSIAQQTIPSFEIVKEESIDAPVDIVFQTILDQMGPNSEMDDGTPFPMVLEAWPGGRWYRDLGNNTGHFWGHVQVIKPPRLLEICGPLFMSYPAISHVQYRLTDADQRTQLKLVHKAVGLISAEHRDGVDLGWSHEINKIREIAERHVGERGGG